MHNTETMRPVPAAMVPALEDGENAIGAKEVITWVESEVKKVL